MTHPVNTNGIPTTTSHTTAYRGRFAPSPTGPLHFGSLVGALASYLDARHQQGTWLLRIEDVDPLREPPDAADRILKTLEAHGLYWDETPIYQSQRSDAYEQSLDWLLAHNHVYRCPCSRSQLQEHQGRHPFQCREFPQAPAPNQALRFKVEQGTLTLQDRIQGGLIFEPVAEVDDFVLKRKEGFYAYQLAVVVDDAASNITDVVRGSDLLDSLPWQILLQRALGLPQPRYAHFPVIHNASGQKLSKQNKSPAINDQTATQNLTNALAALQLEVPADLLGAAPQTLLSWAIPQWSLDRIPASLSLPDARIDTD